MTHRRQRHRSSASAAAGLPRNARGLAYGVLTGWQQRGAFAGRVLDELTREHQTLPADRGLALDISYTAIRRQATIDAILSAFVDRPRNNIEDGLWRLLQIGVCQLVLLEGIPGHAAVHETVELARQLQCPQWTGLINGVLRSVAASLSDETSSSPQSHLVPVGEDRFRALDRPVFVDPARKPGDYLAKAYSYPRWLMRDWLDRYGFEEVSRLGRWFNRAALPSIRVNTLQQQPDVVRQTLAAAGVTTEPGRFPESLRARSTVRPADLPGFAEGWFSIQDESAMAAARLVDPQPGERILDLCAAPGGKATHLAELMQDTGTIMAADVDEIRLQKVAENAQRLRLSSIEAVPISDTAEGLPAVPFDAVLLDVPCSNTGVLGKRPEARWRITPQGIDELVDLQLRLLTLAVDRVRSGGRVVYSTCSIDPRENRDVVDRVLAMHPGLALESELAHIPGRPADGGYQAKLRR